MSRKLWTRRAVISTGILGVLALLSWQFRRRDSNENLVRRMLARRAGAIRLAPGELDRFVEAYMRVDNWRIDALRELVPFDRLYGLPIYDRLIPGESAAALELAERHVVTALLQSTDFFSSGGAGAGARFVSWPRNCANPFARTRAMQ